MLPLRMWICAPERSVRRYSRSLRSMNSTDSPARSAACGAVASSAARGSIAGPVMRASPTDGVGRGRTRRAVDPPPGRSRRLRCAPALALGLGFAYQAAEPAEGSIGRHSAALAGLWRFRRRRRQCGAGSLQELLYEGQLAARAGRLDAIQHVLVQQLRRAGGVRALVHDVVDAAEERVDRRLVLAAAKQRLHLAHE